MANEEPIKRKCPMVYLEAGDTMCQFTVEGHSDGEKVQVHCVLAIGDDSPSWCPIRRRSDALFARRA